MRRADLLKPDVLSEVILLGAGALGFAILVLLLNVVLTKGAVEPVTRVGPVRQGTRGDARHLLQLNDFQVLKSGIGEF